MREFESEKGNKQSSSYEVIHFYKKLYFNPGLYEEGASSRHSYSVTEEVPPSPGYLSPRGARVRPRSMPSENVFCEIGEN